MTRCLAAVLLVGVAVVTSGQGFGQEPKLRDTLEGYWGQGNVAFSPNGKMLAAPGQSHGTPKLWDVTSGLGVSMLPHLNQIITCVAFSPDNRIVATGVCKSIAPKMAGNIWLWEVASGKVRGTLSGDTGLVYSVAFNSNGTVLASGNDDSTVTLWDVRTGQEMASLNGHGNRQYVTSVAFSGDNMLLASGSSDKTLKLWDVKTGKEKATLIGHTNVVTAVAFDGDGKLLASGSYDGTVRLWDVKSGKEMARWKAAEPPQPLRSPSWHSVAFSPDGTLLASGGFGTDFQGLIHLWDVKTGIKKVAFTAHKIAVSSVVFSPDGKLLASASQDNTVKLWDISVMKKTGK